MKNGEVLLLKRKSKEFGDERYGFVGGHVEKNEDIKRAIIREVKEEINIEIEEKDLKYRNVLNRKVDKEIQYIDFIFEANNWKRYMFVFWVVKDSLM